MNGHTTRSVLSISALAIASIIVLVTQGCISDQGSFNNVEITGYVRSESDSTPVPGAFLLIDVDVQYSKGTDNYTNSDGYYEYRVTVPTRDWNPIEILVTVADVDGDLNGIFISEDTLLYEDNTEHLLNIAFALDFYVHFIEDTTCLGSGPSL
ncbi:MAG: hypothetical protein JXA64_04265 [Candidatus Fermentibacteraceae bacterium]|nr:hypothetical protein [Candidatus Fermentibacteraceae bacterium]